MHGRRHVPSLSRGEAALLVVHYYSCIKDIVASCFAGIPERGILRRSRRLDCVLLRHSLVLARLSFFSPASFFWYYILSYPSAFSILLLRSFRRYCPLRCRAWLARVCSERAGPRTRTHTYFLLRRVPLSTSRSSPFRIFGAAAAAACLPAPYCLLPRARCLALFFSFPPSHVAVSLPRLSISSFRASSLYFLFLAVGFRVLSLSPRCSPCPEWKERAPLRSSFLRSVLSRSLLLLFFCLSRRLACLTAAARRRVLLSRPQRPVLSSPRFPRRAVAVGKS